jgi:acetate---CoA ligase (ADP-forming)
MDLRRLFKPQSMAVVGVSLGNDSHPANVIYNKNYLRHQVRVYGVNAKGGTIRGEPVYGRTSAVPEQVDLAVIATRADIVPEVMEDCIGAGVGGAIVISGGFAETGASDLQDRLTAIGRTNGFPFIGPNCLGIYAPPYMDTFFIPSERLVRPEKGRVALVSQSGGVLVDHMIKCETEGVGVSLGVSIGNKALIREIDLLDYFASDPDTDVISFYVEGFGRGEGREFVKAAAACPKPVIVLKAGKTAAGTKAGSSHTASLAGDYRGFSSVMAQHGIVEALDEFEIVAFAEALSCYKHPIEGRIGIITGSGGHGALATDMCLDHGLLVPTLGDEARKGLREALSPVIRDIASLANPVDLTGSARDDDFVAAARWMSGRDEVDCIIALLLPYIPGITVDLGARLSLVNQQEGKPIIAYVPHVEKYNMLIEGFIFNQIPVAHSVEDAIHMAEALRRNKRC